MAEIRELDEERNDFVDNAIYDLIVQLDPNRAITADDLVFDSVALDLRETIALAIEDYYVKKGLCTDKQFRDYYTDEEIDNAD